MANCMLAVLLALCFNVRDFGAVGDGKTKDTSSIQRALDACAVSGGRVVVPSGTYLIGSIWLKSHTELHLEKGAVLKGSDNLGDYNAEDAYVQNWGSKSEGWRGKHLIICVEQTDVSITGDGTIDGNGSAFFVPAEKMRSGGDFVWRRGFASTLDKANAVRPGQELAFVECSNVRIEGVYIRDSACWTCFFHGCDGVRVNDVTIRNNLCHANTDGFDIDSCRDVVIAGCAIFTGDDMFAIRGDPKRLKKGDRVCENVVISNCIGACSASGVRIGVGDGAIRNVRISDLHIKEAGHGLLVQSCYPSSRHNGVDISDIVFEDITIDDSGHAIIVTAGTPKAEAILSNVVFRNIRIRTAGSVIVEGAGKTRPKDVRFENVQLAIEPPLRERIGNGDWEVVGKANSSDAAICVESADGVVFSNMTVTRAVGVKSRTDDYMIVDSTMSK